MGMVKGKVADGRVEIELSGRVDSNNAPKVEADIMAIIGASRGIPLDLDMKDLEYISSAGLRVLLHLKKIFPDMTLSNVNSDVYEILDMTGFTQMMTVEKAYRVVSVEGCQEIGRGAKGTIYRIDQDNVVKVYKDADALAQIQHEREVARVALVLGIPTAISYDVVRVGDGYGSVFELLKAKSFSEIISEDPEKLDWCVREYVEMLRKIHSTVVPPGKLPDMREKAIEWALSIKDQLPEEAGNKLVSMIEAVPYDDHMIHGDYHTKNLELQGDEVLIIDMDTLAVGHPVFELGNIYNAFRGFSEYDHENIKRFQGFDYDTATDFWKKALKLYLGTNDAGFADAVEDKARIVGYARLLNRTVRRHTTDTPEGLAEAELWKKNLLELLERTDSLLFTPNEIETEAAESNLPDVLAFVDEKLSEAGCTVKDRTRIAIAAEEVFVNIAKYAYPLGSGTAGIRVECGGTPLTATLTFTDSGVPFDPLKKSDPDITLSAEDRQIGGLGIFMTKKIMDEVSYEYRNGRNILTLRKVLQS